MDWDKYPGMVCQYNLNQDCSIWSADGTSCYASSPHFQITEEEAQAIQTSIKTKQGPIYQAADDDDDSSLGGNSHFRIAGQDFVCTVIDEHGGLKGTSKVGDGDGESISVRALLQPACLLIATQHDTSNPAPALQMWTTTNMIQMEVGRHGGSTKVRTYEAKPGSY